MLDWMKSKKTKKSVTEEVNERISIKNRIIDAVKEKNLKLQNKVKKLEEQLLGIDQKNNHLDQYSRRNNLEIQGIPSNIIDDELEGKVIDKFSCLSTEVKGSDIKGCLRLDYTNPKNTIVRFINQKFCYQSLDTKKDLHKLDNRRLGFNPVKTYFSENLVPTNQLLAWKCTEWNEPP